MKRAVGFAVVMSLALVAVFSTDAHGQAPGSGSQAPPPSAPAEPPAAWRRWIDPQVGTYGLRYRTIADGAGDVTTNQLQHKATLRIRFKIDRAGQFGLVLGGLTGSSYTGSWNPTGLGTGEPTFDFFPRQLFLSAAPVKSVELQMGSLYMQRGELTEIVSYDNDGYVMGERLLLRAPSRLYFDEIAVTTGYVNDVRLPNLFDRTRRIGDWNYGQVVATKRLHPALSVTAEYAGLGDQHVMRAAAVIRSKRLRVVDLLRFEEYTRLDARAFGFDVEGQKAVSSRTTVGVGLADIDRFAGALNADRFGQGRRFYTSTSTRLVNDLVLQTWLGHAVGDTRGFANRTRFDVIVEYDLLRSLTRHGVLR